MAMYGLNVSIEGHIYDIMHQGGGAVDPLLNEIVLWF